MKRTLWLLIFSAMAANAQNVYFSGAIDLRNAILGSNPTHNKPAIDAVVAFGMIGGRTEVVVGYERFESICFDKFFFSAGHHFKLNEQWRLIPSIEPSLIGRWGTDWQTTSSHLSIGANLGLRYKIRRQVSLELQCNALPRTDLFARYPEIHSKVPIIISTYFKILYRL